MISGSNPWLNSEQLINIIIVTGTRSLYLKPRHQPGWAVLLEDVSWAALVWRTVRTWRMVWDWPLFCSGDCSSWCLDQLTATSCVDPQLVSVTFADLAPLESCLVHPWSVHCPPCSPHWLAWLHWWVWSPLHSAMMTTSRDHRTVSILSDHDTYLRLSWSLGSIGPGGDCCHHDITGSRPGTMICTVTIDSGLNIAVTRAGAADQRRLVTNSFETRLKIRRKTTQGSWYHGIISARRGRTWIW